MLRPFNTLSGHVLCYVECCSEEYKYDWLHLLFLFPLPDLIPAPNNTRYRTLLSTILNLLVRLYMADVKSLQYFIH